jgi:acid phosphatase type 7
MSSLSYKYGNRLFLLRLCISLVAMGCLGGSPKSACSDSVDTTAQLETPDSSSHSRTVGEPERIILNLTSTPSTSQAVTWRTDRGVARPQAQIVQATGFSNFDENVRTADARTQSITLDDGRVVHHHTLMFESLVPDTVYAYRVGMEGGWSEWSQFKTARSGRAPFTFVYFGDPQEEIKSKCSRIFRAAYKKAPDADFWHFVGDLVDSGDKDEQWEELFDALGWIPRTIPVILLPGNHEYPDKRFVKGADYQLFPLWRPHFTLPENGPAGLEETAYYIDFQGVRLVMLNGNERLEEQAKWLDGTLSASPPSWTIVAIHQPIYSTAKRRSNTALQQLFIPIFDKHAVDLVLQGHDHTYSRSYKIKNGAKAGPHESGTVYVISVSGPKSYPVNSADPHLMEKTGTGLQLFQVISVDPARLTYESFDATGALYDTFVLER